METRVITAHVPLPLAKQIDALAKQMERPRGWIVKQALRDWVAAEEWKHQGTLDALAQADRGECIPHEEVVKWIQAKKKSLKKKLS